MRKTAAKAATYMIQVGPMIMIPIQKVAPARGDDSRTKFRMGCPEHLRPIRSRTWCECGAHEVTNGTIKLLEYGDQWIPFSESDMDAIPLPTSKRIIEVIGYIPEGDVPAELFAKPYWCYPPEEAQYVLLHKVLWRALKESGKVGLAKIGFTGKEWLAIVRPTQYDGRPLLGVELLIWAADYRSPANSLSDVNADQKLVDQMKKLLEVQAIAFEHEKYESFQELAIQQLLTQKLNGEVISPLAEVALPETTISIEDILSNAIAAAEANVAAGAAV